MTKAQFVAMIALIVFLVVVILLMAVKIYNLEWLVDMKDQVIGLWELNSQYWCK